MGTIRSNNRIAQLIWLLVAVVFIADLVLPPRFDIVYAYLLAHFLAIVFKEKSDVLLLAVVTTTLSILAAVFKPREVALEQVFLERMPPIVSFWAAAFFVVRFIALREVEEQQKGRFEALFRYASNGILLTSRQGEIVMTNPALETLFGFESGEMLGKKIEVLIPHRFSNHHAEHRQNYHQNPHPRSMGIGLDLYGLKKDGSEFPVEVSLSPFKSVEGEFVVAFVVDNTFRKKYEQSILQQKQELANLTKALGELNESLEAKVEARTHELEQAKNDLSVALEKERELGELKSRFVSMASHEFRTPLTSVLSSASLISQYADRQDLVNVKKHAERIKNAIHSLNTILTEFLSLGRLEEGRIQPKPEPVDLPECVESVHQELKSLFKAGQNFQYSHSGETAVRLDGGLLKNILINLVSNAIKYSPVNSTITVQSLVNGKTVRVSIRDEGIGIPLSEQKHLFDRFFRASNATNVQGTGLGLYIVQRYAEMMNGKVGFESEAEKGSEFWAEFEV